MIYLIILNILGKGGILSAVAEGSTRYALAWLIQIWCSGAVSIFALLTGYTGYTEEEKRADWPGHLTLWLEVIFYGVLICVIYKWFHPDLVSISTVGNMFLPLINNIYPLFSILTGLRILRPFLDSAIRHTCKKDLQRLMILMFIGFSCFTVISDTFHPSGGSTLIWFVILYLLGASMKKTETAQKMKPWKAFICIFMISLSAWVWKLSGGKFSFLAHEITQDSLLSSTSPVILAASVFHVILFSKLRIPAKAAKIIGFFSSGAIAIYLISYHPIICTNEIENRFTGWAVLHNYDILGRILGLTMGITCITLIIDIFRQLLFKRLKIRLFFQTFLYDSEATGSIEKLAEPLFGILFIGIWAFLFRKCPYGYGYMDEALYLTVPYRILHFGDGLLVHEWHEFQLSTFPTLPLMMLYDLFFKSTEQILLNYRYIYTFLWGCSAVFFYFRMRKFSKTGAAAASLAYLIHAPYGIMAFSYNSIGVMFLLNAFIIAITAEKHKSLQYSICGVFLAGAILCCPYLLVIYLILSLYAAVQIKKKNKYILKFWAFVTLGAFCLFVIFCAFLLSRGTLQDILRAIPIVLDDVEHPDRNQVHKTIEYFDLIIHCAPMAPHILIIFVVMCIISRIWKNTADWCLIIVLLSVITVMTYFTNKPFYIHYLMLPVCLIGLFCRINSDEAEIRLLFRRIWIPEMIYTFCLNYSSNQQLHALTNAATVPAFASIIILVQYFMSGKKINLFSKKFAAACAALFFIVLIKDELILRYQVIFFENDIADQTAYARSGPQKGIRMTENKLEAYNKIMDEIIISIREDDSIKQVLFFVNDPVLYLCSEKGIGAFSAWLPGINEHTVKRLDLYYDLNPQKKPDAVYIPFENKSYLDHFIGLGYTEHQTSEGIFFLVKNAN